MRRPVGHRSRASSVGDEQRADDGLPRRQPSGRPNTSSRAICAPRVRPAPRPARDPAMRRSVCWCGVGPTVWRRLRCGSRLRCSARGRGAAGHLRTAGRPSRSRRGSGVDPWEWKWPSRVRAAAEGWPWRQSRGGQVGPWVSEAVARTGGFSQTYTTLGDNVW